MASSTFKTNCVQDLNHFQVLCDVLEHFVHQRSFTLSFQGTKGQLSNGRDKKYTSQSLLFLSTPQSIESDSHLSFRHN